MTEDHTTTSTSEPTPNQTGAAGAEATTRRGACSHRRLVPPELKKGVRGKKPINTACTVEEFRALVNDTHLKMDQLAKLCHRTKTTMYQYGCESGDPVPIDVITRMKAIAEWTNGRLKDDDYTAICMNYIKIHRM